MSLQAFSLPATIACAAAVIAYFSATSNSGGHYLVAL